MLQADLDIGSML